MTRIAVDIVPVVIGLGFLLVTAAVVVVYQVHTRLLRREVRRVQRERSLAWASSPAVAPASAARQAERFPDLAPVLQFSAAQRRWADRLRLDRTATVQAHDTSTITRSAGA